MTEPSQGARIDGHHNVIVQASGGSRVDVALGATLALEPLPDPAALPPATSEYHLLQASAAITEFVGRDYVLGQLREWLKRPDALSIQVVTGGAGSGKTRLAHELLRGVPAGWQAGQIQPTHLRSVPDHQLPLAWRWDRPTLVVIDYASECGPALAAWIAALAPAASAERPMRLLLLERGAGEETGWFAEVRGLWSRTSLPALRGVLPPALHPPLGSLHEDAHRTALFVAARRAARALHGAAGPDPLADAQLEAWVRESTWRDPLSLMMAGVLSASAEGGSLVRMNPRELAAELARRERERILRDPHVDKNPTAGELALQMAVRVTLAGGLPAQDIRKALQATAIALELTDAAAQSDARTVLLNKLPGEPGPLSPLRPDLPAEAFVLTELFGDNGFGPDAAGDALEFAWKRDRATAISFWIRMIHDFSDPAHPEDRHSCRTHLALDCLGNRADVEVGEARLELFNELLKELPNHSLVFLNVALQWSRSIVQELKARAVSGGLGWELRYRRALADYAIRLAEVGQSAAAFEAGEELVTLDRRLVEVSTAAFLPYLADSLTNLGNHLYELGSLEKALRATQEAVAINRQLESTHPDQYVSNLAASLNNLANRFSSVGRLECALDAARETVTTYGQLVACQPAENVPLLARAQLNLGKILSENGQREEALAVTKDAVDTYVQLAESQPDAFLPDLAMALTALGARYMTLGVREEAVRATQEAAFSFRKLVSIAPSRFLPGLAGALSNLASCLASLERVDEARVIVEEAVQIQRKLSEKEPQRHLSNLATYLGNQGRIQLLAERFEEARASFGHALRAIVVPLVSATSVHRQLALALIDDYRKACVRSQLPAELDALEPVLTALSVVEANQGGPNRDV